MKLKIFVMFIIVISLLTSLTFLSSGEIDRDPEMDIYLIANEIHIGIVLPRKNAVYDWNTFIVDNYFPDPSLDLDWIEFGWGDRRFYFEMPTWDHFTWQLAADALFLPDPAVMHVGLMNISDYPNSVTKVRINYKTYQKIISAVKESIVIKNGRPILLHGKGYSPQDNFFEAHGSYSLLRTCNVWTADIFKAAGLKHPLWSPTKYGMERLWK